MSDRQFNPNRIRSHRNLDQSSEAGVTLLELLIVIVILGLLATLGTTQVLSYLGRAKSETAKLQIKELSTALALYKVDVGHVPSTEEGLRSLVERPTNTPDWRGPYLQRSDALNDPWKRPYIYTAPGVHGEYDLVTYGAAGKPGGSGEDEEISNSTQPQ